MRIATERFGELDVPEESLIEFAAGLPAFETVRRFAVIRRDGSAPFAWLQAADRSDLAFLVLNPWDFCPDYDLDISAADCRELGLTDPEAAEVYAILTVRGGIRTATANLLAPIVINRRERKGKQVINNCSGYTTRHGVLSEMQRPEPRRKCLAVAVNP